MKKLTLILITLLCLTGISQAEDEYLAWMGPVMVGGGTVDAGDPDACPGGDADTACESFEGSNACNSGQSTCDYASYNTTEVNGTIGADTAASSSCTDKGSYEATFTATTTGATIVLENDSISETTVYVSFMLKVVTENLSDEEDALIFGLGGGGDVQLHVAQAIGGDKILAFIDNGDDVVLSSAITVGNWHEVGLLYISGTRIELWLDGVSQGSDTSGISSDTITKAAVVCVNPDAAPFVYVVDNIKVDDDALPDACAGN